MEVRIGDCIDCNPTVKLTKGNEYPLIDIDKIIVGKKLVTNKETIIYGKQSGCKFQNGDTLMARITPCLENGKMAMASIPDKGIGSTEFFVFRGKKDITDNEYVYYFLKQQYIRNLAANSMSGASGRQRADLKFIKKIKFDLPSLPTQQKIASILSTYDSLIENNTKRIRLLEQMAENLYKEWFVRFRFPGHENVKVENGLPKGWKKGNVAEYAEIMSGGTPKTDNESYYGGGIPFFTPKDARDCIFSHSTLTNITEDGLNHCNSKLYPKGTVTITARGTVGRVNMMGCPMAMNQSCFALKSKNHKNNIFLFFALRDASALMKKMASGGVFDTIILKTFEHIPMCIPMQDTINAFDAIIKPTLGSIYSLEKQVELLTRQRDLLLPRLMSGKLEVKL